MKTKVDVYSEVILRLNCRKQTMVIEGGCNGEYIKPPLPWYCWVSGMPQWELYLGQCSGNIRGHVSVIVVIVPGYVSVGIIPGYFIVKSYPVHVRNCAPYISEGISIWPAQWDMYPGTSQCHRTRYISPATYPVDYTRVFLSWIVPKTSQWELNNECYPHVVLHEYVKGNRHKRQLRKQILDITPLKRTPPAQWSYDVVTYHQVIPFQCHNSLYTSNVLYFIWSFSSSSYCTITRLLLLQNILSNVHSRIVLSHLPHHCKALNSLICADVPLRNYSLNSLICAH